MTEIPPENINDVARIVTLVFGKTKDGSASYWCYVAVKPTEHQRFMQLYEQGNMNLVDFEANGFGEIIVSGKGRTPPKEVTHQVAQIYNLNLDELFRETSAEAALEKKILQFKKPSET